jgi:uncharacterized protein YabN with tetrapyrrole methylase and pyrophosphatase domain
MSNEKQSCSALIDLIALEKDARDFGFDWPDVPMIIDQAIDECREIMETIEHQETPERLQEEIGDLLHTAVSLCVFAGFDVEETLSKVNGKFSGRMQAIKNLTHNQGLENLKDQPFEFMLELWDKAKLITKKC